MYRLADIYYTGQMLDGTPPQDGVKSMSPSFGQGETVVMEVYISFMGEVIDPKKHTVFATIKKTPYATNVLWEGLMNAGLYPVKDTVGRYYIIIPKDDSARFLAGTYYLDISVQEKPAQGKLVSDLRVVVGSYTFNIELKASSPNPDLPVVDVTLVGIEPGSPTSITTYEVVSVERTVPKPVPSP